jgi:hypothetical protein
MYWKDNNIIELRASTSGISGFAVPSKPEDWAPTGDALFCDGLFSDAADSYQKAHMSREAAIAKAHQLEQEARQIKLHVTGRRSRAFKEAAEAFLTCASAQASPGERTDFLRHAGQCFAEAKRHDLAAKAYLDASMFTMSVCHYRLAQKLYDAMAITRAHNGLIEDDVVESVTETAKYVWTNEQKFKYVRVCILSFSFHNFVLAVKLRN